MNTILYEIALRCTELSLNRLPPQVVEKAGYVVLDAVDNFLEGDLVRSVTDPVYGAMIEEEGSATIFGRPRRATPENAAFYNVVSGSITARNDHHPGGNVHPGSVLIPALIAAAEAKHLGGRALLEAVIVGYEVMIRLGAVLKKGRAYPLSKSLRPSMFPTPVGVALALAKLQGMDATTATNAAALACNHLCGLNQWRLEGTGEDVYQNGWDTVNAMGAIRLAQHGVRGAMGNLDGEYGFLKLFEADACAPDLLDGLGTDFKILETRSKVTGACARVLAPCQLAQELNENETFRLEDLERLILHINRKCTQMSWFTNRRITCQSESINSVPFAVAATLAAGDIDLVSWFPPFDPRIEGIMGRVQLVYDDISQEHLDPDGYRMEAHMKDGTVVPGEKLTYEALTYEGIEKRFLKTVALRLGQERAEALRDMILDLEAVEDMGQLTDRFSVR